MNEIILNWLDLEKESNVLKTIHLAYFIQSQMRADVNLESNMYL